ncbi:response regulator [Maribacter ulvicola]|uniref:Response regulator receiver domain-containing protein n=1 Tax=Maribacter ulvicola TaxID=228959 RepID=A0A1N7AAG4_9FLAO|nr:response regulator [Maribacter ulvicola]SIR36009.1 Response regulator receiver domain-containing protein [Maribacter ulvicola]
MKKISDITIIDDDAITVFGLRKLISSSIECKSVESYGNGKIALDAMIHIFNNDQRIPQIIFLDINMPIMDGWEFLDAFIKIPIKDKIRINIVTSSIDPFDKKQWEYYKSKSHHLITFNQKPIDRNKITEITQVA